MAEMRPALGDNLVLPFRTVQSGVTGRLVRMGSVADTILARHNTPEPVSEVLGQALVLAALLGPGLKFEGKLIVQTKTDGPVDFLVVDFEKPGRLRGYVRYDKRMFAPGAAALGRNALLGNGHLAMTIDQGPEMERYQGIVGLENTTLGEAALAYFRQSEQLPTYLRLAVARHFIAGQSGEPGRWAWRAGGLLIQKLASKGGLVRAEAQTGEDETQIEGVDGEDWTRARLLAATVEDHELLDPAIAPDRLLYRLFHEEGVTAEPALPLEVYCSCSRERVQGFLKSFGPEELSDMREADGGVAVTCEFCTTRYHFAEAELI